VIKLWIGLEVGGTEVKTLVLELGVHEIRTL
jgi:hypothetical protein